ncbi:MAG TPA: hypothetical protein VIH17_01685 [Candidatus Acidoferrales bacterium]
MSPYDLVMNVCGLAQAEAAAAVADHLASGCPECTRNHHLWKAFRAFAQNDLSFEPPAETLDGAFGLFASASECPAPIQTVLATLVFDSFALPASAGLRSPRQAAYRQRLYAASGYYIDLNVERLPDDKLNITGQILREDPPTPPGTLFMVKLFHQSELIATTLTNPLGEFSFENAPEYASTITLCLDDKEAMVWVGAPPTGKEDAT